MWRFVSRHGKKAALLALAAAGVYGGARYLLRRSRGDDVKQKAISDQLRERRLREHSDGNKVTCISTVASLLPVLRDTMMKELNAEEITAQLREKPPNRIDLWERLKLISFSRAVASVYGCVLLVTYLRIQLSLLGAHLGLHGCGSTNVRDEVQKQYLASVNYFLQNGMVAMSRAILDASEIVLEGFSLKQELTGQGVLQLVNDIRFQLSSSLAQQQRSPRAGAGSSSITESSSPLLQFMMPRESLLQRRVGELEELMSATRDVLESGELCCVMEGVLKRGVTQFTKQFSDIYHSAVQGMEVLPIARVIPLLTDQSHSFCSSPAFAQYLVEDAGLRKLADNVYEAFSWCP